MLLFALTPTVIISIILGYFAILIFISYLTAGNSDSNTFFSANQNSPWLLVAIGMIGASLSGVTFISIPGVVGAGGGNQQFSYMQMVLGYLVGYFVIASVLMPIYYKHNLTSIYGFLEERLGKGSYKTGAGFFLLSRLVGSAFRMYLVALVFDKFVLGPMGIPFWLTVLISIVLIWVYTFKGGIKTIVFTDVFQTVSMITALILTIVAITSSLGINVTETMTAIKDANLDKWWFFEEGWNDPNNFFKQFVSGALIALVMTGLDQDMMQKNLTCRSLKDAQKNMFLFSIILVFANLLFLTLGALMYIYIDKMGIPVPDRSDYLFPTLALQHLSPIVGVCFIVGITAANYASADSALTSLTTSFCIDFLDMQKSNKSEEEKKKTRTWVHVGFSVLIFLTIMLFAIINNDAVVNNVFKAAGYTYGPLLGLFSFAILTKRSVLDKWVWLICIGAAVLSYFLDIYSTDLFWGLKFGYLNLLVNGLLTFVGLMLISNKK
ncbi:MAG: sodium:solute symporter [Saprospiraceae bacterium]|nr:sodium:solute symporter [Saprospiraceae bacterium]